MAFSDILGGVARALIRPGASSDIVAITAFGGFVPLFTDARPMMATVYEDAKLMEHPIETGATIADHIVFPPIEIDIPFVCVGDFSYRSTYAALRETFRAGTRLTVRTRTGTYPNMVISEMPHEETADIFDGITLRVRLREALFVTPQTELAPEQVKNPTQASSTARGAQQARTPAPAAASRVTETATDSGAGAKPAGSRLYQWAYGE